MFVAGPISEDDFYEWEALVVGPEGTPYVSRVGVEMTAMSSESRERPTRIQCAETCFACWALIWQEGGVFCAKLSFVSVSPLLFRSDRLWTLICSNTTSRSSPISVLMPSGNNRILSSTYGDEQPKDYPLNPFKMVFDPPVYHPNGKPDHALSSAPLSDQTSTDINLS